MKKNALCLLFLSSLLVTSCDLNGNIDEYEEPEIVIRTTRPELFTLDRAGEPLLVDSNVKKYTDAMYRQRDTGAKESESNINNLHGDTVDVADYLGNYDYSVPVEVVFHIDESLKDESFRVRYWTEGNDDNYKEVDAIKGDDKCTASLVNLLSGKNYEWKVVTTSGISSGNEYFTTQDYVRIVTIGDLYNVRDAGGWTTIDGKRIKQGRLYRGCEINPKKTSSGHNKNVTEEGKKTFVKDLGITTQLDLRSEEESDNMTECAFGSNIEYKRMIIESYHNGMDPTKPDFSGPNIKICFEDYFAHLDEKVIYYNCYGGADRTGTVAFLLGAVLGMTYTDLIIDYEATSFCGSKKQHTLHTTYNYYPDMIDYIKSLSWYSESKTLKEIIEQYLIQICGVSKTTIDKIRSIMLEDK